MTEMSQSPFTTTQASLGEVRQWLERLLAGDALQEAEAAAVMRSLTDPDHPSALAGALLAALRAKGITAAELRGFASAMRALARRPVLSESKTAQAIDIVGTGGDASGSFNLSTGAALLAAACEQPVTKHGNRSISSRSGSADVLEALGLPLPLDEQDAGECLNALNFTFFFAPYYHPAMKSIAPVRQALGVKTIFNVLGPLTNPASPPFLLVGAYSADMAKLMAEALSGMTQLVRAFVIHGASGWDEPTPMGPFVLFDVTPGSIHETCRDPLDVGLARCTADDLRGGEAPHNAQAMREVFAGRALGAHADALVLGAGLALECTGRVPDWHEGITLARTAITDGRALAMLTRLQEFGKRGQ
jgi:anthranilate phosphoribosyltransferase